MVMLLTLSTGCAPRITLFGGGGDPLEEYVLEGTGREKVLVIPVRGFIGDGPRKGLLGSRPGLVQQVISHLRKAESDERVRAVLLKIDSPGGTVTASDLLYHELAAFRERTGVALGAAMMGVAASGGYYVALAAEWIMAHPTTITGSVGVIFIQPKTRGLMEKIGLDVQVYKTGKFKDMGSMFRENSPEEDAILDGLVAEMGARFHDRVRTRRNLTPDQLATVGTARLFSASDALRTGMVDAVGYLPDALEQVKTMAGLPPDAKVVVYRRTDIPDDHIYNDAGAAIPAAPLSLIDTGLPDLQPPGPGFYYLWYPAASEP